MTQQLIDIKMTVNGREYTGRVEPRLTLADFLRNELDLTGTHLGCEHGVCGACTILVDGEAVRSCLLLAVQADGATLMTVEGLANGDELHPLQAQFQENHALQCGFCTPGFLMTAYAFPAGQPQPDGGRGPHRHRRQHLPLHRLRAHREGNNGDGDGVITRVATNWQVYDDDHQAKADDRRRTAATPPGRREAV